jgi:hypothetical protein
MTTNTGPVLDPQNATHVKDMPPLVVTTTGIPTGEHVEVPPTPEKRSRRTLWISVALVAVIALAAGVIAYVFYNPAPVPTAHMGLSDSAWLEYRAGERMVGLMPVATTAAADWQDYRAGERYTVTFPGRTADWLDYRAGER